MKPLPQKSSLFYLLILLANNYCIGQQHPFNIGIEAGPNITNLRGTSFVDKYSNPAWGAYSTFNCIWNINSRFALRTGISYDFKNSDIEGDYYYGPNLYHFKIDYKYQLISLPIAVRTNFQIFRTTIWFDIGCYASRYLSGKGHATQTNSSGEYYYSDPKIYIRSHLGLISGIGINQKISNRLIASFGIKNEFGLNNYQISGEYTKPNSFGLVLGVYYQLGKSNTGK